MSKKEKEEGGEAPDIKQVIPKEGIVDLARRVKVEITKDDDAHFYEKGEEITCGETLANKIVANGWGKIISMFLLLAAFAFSAQAQNTVTYVLGKVVSNMPTTSHLFLIKDTVSNTNTNYLSSGYTGSGVNPVPTTAIGTKMVNVAYTTTISALFTKISGTLAGTATLQGSIDGTDYYTVTSAPYAVTATYTVTDVATQTKSWVLYGNPYKYYRVSWTGAGTMSGTVQGSVWSH